MEGMCGGGERVRVRVSLGFNNISEVAVGAVCLLICSSVILREKGFFFTK